MHFSEVEEALFNQLLDMLVMQPTHFLKVRRFFQTFLKLGVQSLKDIDLEVRVNVVNQKGHVLSELHGLAEEFVVTHLFHRFHFDLPRVLQFKLHPLYWKQEAEQLVVLLQRVRTQDEMQRPFNSIV